MREYKFRASSENQDLLQDRYDNLKHETIEKLREIIDLLYLGK